MRGFILAKVNPGKESDFFSDLGAIQQVRGVFYLFEEYEFLVEVEADTIEDLRRVMMSDIRHLPGVEKAATFVEGDSNRLPPVTRQNMEASEEVASVFHWMARAKTKLEEKH